MNRRVLILYAVSALVFGAINMRALALPLYAVEGGATRAQVGLLFGFMMAAAALLSVPSGYLTDRLGRRRVLITAAVSGVAANLLTATTHNINLLYLTQIILGFGSGLTWTATMAALVDLVPRAKVARAMGLLSLFMQTGMLLGPALAGVLLVVVDLRTDILLSAVPFAAVLGLLLLLPGDQRKDLHRGPLLAPARTLLSSRHFLFAALGLFGTATLWGTLNSYFAVFAKESALLPGAMIGYLLAIQAVVNGLSRLPSGWLIDRVTSRGRLVTIATILYAVGLAVLPHLHSFLALALLLIVSTPLVALAFMTSNVIFATIAPPDMRGLAMGLNSTFLYLGLGLAPTALSMVFSAQGYIAGFTAAAAIAMLIAVGRGLLLLPGRTRPDRSLGSTVKP